MGDPEYSMKRLDPPCLISTVLEDDDLGEIAFEESRSSASNSEHSREDRPWIIKKGLNLCYEARTNPAGKPCPERCFPRLRAMDVWRRAIMLVFSVSS